MGAIGDGMQLLRDVSQGLHVRDGWHDEQVIQTVRTAKRPLDVMGIVLIGSQWPQMLLRLAVTRQVQCGFWIVPDCIYEFGHSQTKIIHRASFCIKQMYAAVL